MTEEIGFRFRFRFAGDRAAAEAKLGEIAQAFRQLRLDEVGELVIVDELTQRCEDVPRYYSATPKYYRYWVARTQQDYRACPACGRIYWPGTHVRRMKKRLESML